MAPTTSNVQQEHATSNENKYPRTLRAQDDIDLLNTRRMLESLNAVQDALRAELATSGLSSFVEIDEWLLEHRTADEKLADARKWARYEAEFLHPRAGEKHSIQPKRPCPRCGVERVVRAGRGTGLCRDCLDTLTAAEVAIWADRSAA